MSSEEEKPMTWANEDPDHLRTPTWYGLKSALMSPPIVGRGWGGMASSAGLGARGVHCGNLWDTLPRN